MVIQLRFHGPYPACNTSEDVLAQCPYKEDFGIYFWAVEQHSGAYRIAYIGETGASFYRRTKEHLIQTMGGNYRICDPEMMKQGVQQVLWDGLWRRDTRDQFPQWLSRAEELMPFVKKVLLLKSVFVTPTHVEKRIRRRIEGALAATLRNNDDASSLLPTDIRYVTRSSSEEPIEVTISCEATIEGLPEKISA